MSKSKYGTFICNMETDRPCAMCGRSGRMAWGALCSLCEDAFREATEDFTDEDWDQLEALSPDAVTRRVLASPRRLCVKGGVPSDACQHCVGLT